MVQTPSMATHRCAAADSLSLVRNKVEVHMILAGTGHRPNKLGGYDESTYQRLVRLATNELRALAPTEVITGMALGWDQALADAAIILNIPFAAYVPFEGQDSVWPLGARMKYRVLLAKAARVKLCSPGGYSPQKMQVRNIAMVDDCHQLLALWDGTPGGTANCVRYAASIEKPIEQCWQRYQETR